jgi:AraC family L-rhamnose operon transcriptional activator RhaR
LPVYAGYCAAMSDDDLPLDTSHDQYHFIDGALAYAGYHYHHRPAPLHTHSFVEIAFVAAGAGVHQSRAGRHDMQVGDVVLLRPGVWHGYDDCRGLELYNCCFGTELLRHELAWTREDPLLGYLLWTGPYSAQGHGMLRTHLDSAALAECEIHLEALDTLWHNSVPQHRGDIIGRLSLVFGHLGRAVARTHGPLPGPPGPAHPAVGRAMRLLEARLAYGWTLTELADLLHMAPGYLVRLFRTATGVPPMAYLARLRAEHAAALLLHSDQPITVIGQQVGWPDQNYFARRFRAHYGLSATKYRAQFAARSSRLRPYRPAAAEPQAGVAVTAEPQAGVPVTAEPQAGVPVTAEPQAGVAVTAEPQAG